MLGFQQFMGENNMTTDLVDEGRELIRRGDLISDILTIQFSFSGDADRLDLGFKHKIKLKFYRTPHTHTHTTQTGQRDLHWKSAN